MTTMWIDGESYKITRRQELRIALHAGRTMEMVDQAFRRGQMGHKAYARYQRLWIWGTATEHPRTRNVPLKRWGDRRERIRRAVRSLPDIAPMLARITGKDLTGRNPMPCNL